MRPRASGNGEKGPTDSATAKSSRELGPGGDIAPRQGKEAIRFLEARPHPPCEAERTRSVASCALKGYAGKLGVWGGRRASSRAGQRGTCWGPLGSQSLLRSVQVRETQAAGDLRKRWLPRAGANFVRCGRGRGWGLGTRYLGTGGPSTPAEARAAAPGPGAAWSSARGGPGPRLPGAAPAATLGRRAWLAPRAPLFPRRRRPTLAALPWLRLSALSRVRLCAAGEQGAAGAQRPAPWPAAPHLARVAQPPPPPRLPRPGARPIPVAPPPLPPPPPLPAPAAGRPSSQRESERARESQGGGRRGGRREGPGRPGEGPAAGRPGTRRPPGDRRRDVPLPGVSGGGRLAAEGLGSPAGVVKALAGTGTAGGMTYWAKCGQIRAHSGRSGESSQGRGTREMGRVLGTGQRVWREVSAGDGDCGTAQTRGPGIGLAQLVGGVGVGGCLWGRGRQGRPPGVGGYLRSFFSALVSGRGRAGWVRSGVLREIEGVLGMATHA